LEQEPTYRRLIAGDKNKEVNKDVYEGRVIGPDEKLQLNGYRRDNIPAGTEGEFDLCDADDGDKVIRHFYWECPWGAKSNAWTVSGSNSQWTVKDEGANLGNGALGVINVEVRKKED
jgi:hypothetical protein